MASGKFDLWSSNTKLAGKIEWSSKSNGSVANTSDVTAGIYVRRTDGYTTKGTWTGKVDFGGGEASFSKPSTSVGSDWVLMQTLTRTVAHNNDGTKQEWIHGECFAPSGTSLAGDSVGGSATVTLDTIPRNSAVSLSKTSFNIGETITIKTNRKSTNFTHTIRVVIGSLNKTLATNVGDSWNWATNANQDLYGQVYNVASKGGTIYCDCYNGSTLIGTSSVGFTATAVKSSISSNANWTAGNTLTVNISRPSSKYTHTVEVLVNGTVVGTATGVGTSTSFNTTAFHTNVFRALAQTASKSTTIKVTTYNGSANLGSTTITGTVTAPAASTANVPTWTAGNTYTASITRANSSFTHTVQLLVGATSIFTSTGVGTSVTKSDVSFHTNVFNALAQAGSKETTVKVTTYYNGVQVRSQTSRTGTVTAPAASTSTIDNFNIGDTKTITTTRANASFTHKIEVYWGNWNRTLATNAGTTTSWKTSEDANNMYSKIPNNISGIGTIRTTTYYNGVQVRGHTDRGFTAYVVNSNPTFTAFTYKDNNTTTSNVTGNNQLQIQNKSNLVVTVSAATPKNSATIKKYIATINGKNYESTSTTINIGAISKSGILALQVKAVDSRGLSTSVSKNITVVSYTQPSYTVEVTRKNNYEQETTYKITTGKYDLIPISGSNKNAIQTSQYRYKVSGGSYGSWNAITLTENGANFSYSVLVGNLDNTKTYVFQTQIADKLTTITQEFTLKNGTPIMAMRKQAIGINKIPTFSKGLDISGDVKQDGNLYLDGLEITGTGMLENKTKIIFGNQNTHYANITCDTNGTIGLYNSLISKDKGVIYVPINNTFRPENNNEMDLGLNGTRWRNIYGAGGHFGAINSGIIELYEATPFIDFHFNRTSADFTSRIIEKTSGTLTVERNLTVNGTLTAQLTGNASTATKATTADTATRATTADSAGSATKATQDGNGLVIADNYCKAQSTDGNISESSVGVGQFLQRSGLYTFTDTNGLWRTLINVRHRNGGGDGINYGMQIMHTLTNRNANIGVRFQQNGSWSGWETLYRGVTLYSNGAGSTGTITLSETAANFSILEIYYMDAKSGGSGFKSTRVSSPNGKVALLDFINEDGTNVRLATSRATISGTAIGRSHSQVNYAPATNTYDVNEISIYRVIGYR